MSSLPTVLSLRRPFGNLASLEIDLTVAYEAESKLPEIVTATSGNALYLAGVYGAAYNQLGRAYAQLYREVGVATVASRKRRAVIVLDMASGILKEKGLTTNRSATGSADLRESVCYADEEYCRIEEYRASVEAVKELVEIKLQAFKMAFYAVSAIVKNTADRAGNQVRDLGGHDKIMDEALLGASPAVSGFGKPRY